MEDASSWSPICFQDFVVLLRITCSDKKFCCMDPDNLSTNKKQFVLCLENFWNSRKFSVFCNKSCFSDPSGSSWFLLCFFKYKCCYSETIWGRCMEQKISWFPHTCTWKILSQRSFCLCAFLFLFQDVPIHFLLLRSTLSFCSVNILPFCNMFAIRETCSLNKLKADHEACPLMASNAPIPINFSEYSLVVH